MADPINQLFEQVWLLRVQPHFGIDECQIGASASTLVHVVSMLNVAQVRRLHGLETWTGLKDFYKFCDLIHRNLLVWAVAKHGMPPRELAALDAL